MSQKILYIVRHAKSSWKDLTLNDFDRPLNKRGKRNAPFMADILQKKGVAPELILTSPAKRAKDTALALHTALGGELVERADIYEASLSTLKSHLREAFTVHDSVMLVGHNPAIAALNNTVSNIAIYHIPTVAIVAISLEDIDKLKGTQLFYEYPKKYKKK